MRKCSKCGLGKDDSIFYPNKGCVGGIGYVCIDCHTASRKQYLSEYYKRNKEKIIKQTTKYREKNKERDAERIHLYGVRYKNENRAAINKRYNEYTIKRRKEDILFRLQDNISSSFRKQFKNNGYSKKTRTYKIIGCTFEELKIHLESKFENWMNWDNYGLYNGELNYGWDIDHVIPVNSAVKEDDLIRLNHYTNLQPLCSYNNRYIKKGEY